MINLAQLEKKVLDGERLTPEEGVWMLSDDCDLQGLGALAQWERTRRFPDGVVTYVIDTNPNYTNICDTACKFCAFYRRPQDADAYTLSIEEVMARVSRAVGLGATTVLLQGGHNRDLPFNYYLELVRTLRAKFPQVTPHFFSASEIETMSEVSQLSVEEVLDQLWIAGQRTLPGGGAEVLSERVRRDLAPKKGGPSAWLKVHRAAHQRGFVSTATLMYGHLETPPDLVEHWNHLRGLQDETQGFLSFIPWSFKSEGTALQAKKIDPPGPQTYWRLLAASRLYLDNFPHVQASWFSEGQRVGQVALHYGADDFGGTLIDENVHAAAHFINRATAAQVQELIRQSGFLPRQRDTLFQPVSPPTPVSSF